MPEVRINKYLADQGICSRRKADDHIAHGEVFINGKPAKMGDRIDPARDKVLFKGKPVKPDQVDLEYWAVYKPVGYVSTADDEFDRKKITDLVKTTKRVYPVGRLDGDSEGLIIVTNDGELTNILTHPSNLHTKSYKVVTKPFQRNSPGWIKNKLTEGILIDSKVMRAEKATIHEKDAETGTITLDLELVTGYNRQIRRMCDKIGLEVVRLVRTRVGKLRLADLNLRPGESIKIKKEDIV